MNHTADNKNSRYFYPSETELNSIKSDLFLMKYEDKTSYHKWKDVWSDNLKFKSKVQPHDSFVFRAVMISVPTFHEEFVIDSVYPIAFVYGIQCDKGKSGKTIMVRIDDNFIEWL